MSTPQVMRIWRGDNGGGALVEFVVPVEEGQVVLDAVLSLQAQQVGDLAVRWNCKAGKCGSCSAEINGYPRLMCTTRLSSLPPRGPGYRHPATHLLAHQRFGHRRIRQLREGQEGPGVHAAATGR